MSGRECPAATALLLVGFMLRTADMTEVPAGLHNDEVASISYTTICRIGRSLIQSLRFFSS
jgi:hypothetical protein